MIKILITGFTFLLFGTGYGQADHFIATGKVMDDATKQPLSGASIFCRNTTLGTITNNEGHFSLKLPRGGYDLIISYTGYETREMHINNTNAENLIFELKTTDKNLSEFTISASNEVVDGWAKYGQFFTDNFIGTTPHAAQCVIQNPEALQFFYSKKRNRLKVKEKEDLIIINNALGYKIKYQLDSFAYEYGTDVSTYSGYPFFEELQGTDEQKAAWAQNRALAYNGSRLHFIRSWYDSTLEEEGFVLERVDPSKKILTTRPMKNPYNPAHYQVVENEEVEINMKGKIRVLYQNEMPDKSFLSQYKLPATLTSQISIADIAEPFTIEQNGYFYEQADITNSGYWSWEKIAALLPYDYNPE